jgi:hypothetical protein
VIIGTTRKVARESALRASLVISLALLSCAGCTSDRLRLSTIKQATTLTDLQYQQVLNNLAMFSQNPSALPWHVTLRDGSAQVADLGALTIGGELTHTSKALPSLLGSRTIVEQWGMTPITDDTELRLLRVAYRRALGYPDSLEENHNALANDIAHELKKQTTDFNEFQDRIDRTFNDGKARHRNEQFRGLADAARASIWPNTFLFLLFGNTSGLQDKVANVLFPYQYTVSLYSEDDPEPLPGYEVVSLARLGSLSEVPTVGKQLLIVAEVNRTLHFRVFDAAGTPKDMSADDEKLIDKKPLVAELRALLDSMNWDVSRSSRAEKDRIIAAVSSIVSSAKTGDYYRHLVSALSVVNEKIIVDGEKLCELDNYFVDPNLKNEYKKQVSLVTPFAAEIRRQVKDVAQDVNEIQSGWFHVGRKRDVPKDACYVGQYRDCYVWVDRDGLEELTQFTLKILNFSSLVRDPSILTTPGPRFTPASAFPAL